MFHVISAALARLARRIDAIRDGRVNEAASWYGWTAVQISRTTWEYRDPRFTALCMDRMGLRTGCDHCDEKTETAIENRVLEGIASPINPVWTNAPAIERTSAQGAVMVRSGPRVFLPGGQALVVTCRGGGSDAV